jgi:OOP family OmpA-OmpF porin
MKKTFLILMVACFFLVKAQDKKEYDFNRWSVEVNLGQNKTIRPFSEGYYSSNPNSFMNLKGNFHIDAGTQYMFTNVFGLKSTLGYDLIENLKGSDSKTFKSKLYSLNIEGIINMSRILRFETFSQRLGLQGHAGFQIAGFHNIEGPIQGQKEFDGGVKIGLTPIIKITSDIAINLDFTIVNNLRQHTNWDGGFSKLGNNLTGLYFTNTIGIKYYIGKQIVHADWYLPSQNKHSINNDSNISHQKEIDKLIKDSDNDGVPDYKDKQNNTPKGAVVDNQGQFLDKDNNGVPDNLEKIAEIKVVDTANKKTELTNNTVVLFFVLNSSTLKDDSLDDLYSCIKFLKLNKGLKVELSGFSDIKGGEKVSAKLNEMRTKAIYDLFVSNGIRNNRISIKKTKPNLDDKSDLKKVTVKII